MTSPGDRYVGTELELFRHALHWKRYFARRLAPHLKGAVLEVGAGMGGTTATLSESRDGAWTCLEPDPALASQLRWKIAEGLLPTHCEVVQGTVATLSPERRFDAILYVDVLEHIEDDLAEISAAGARLAPEGKLIVLSPAHPWLFSPFDAAIGHFRRYDRESLERLTPAGLRLVRVEYLDSVGVIANAANRFLMKQGMPTLSQLRFWDRVLVPLSTLLDPLTLRRLGKSVLAVWRESKVDISREH